MLKMADKSQPFAEKVAKYAQSRQDFTPPFLEIDELVIDLKAVEDSTKAHRETAQLCENLDNTILTIR